MKRIILTGGGTAGHVTPNIALLPRLKELGYDIHYIGSYTGIEKDLIKQFEIPYHGISSGKLRRYFSVQNFTDPFRVLKGFREANKLIKELKPDVIFSKGGFVSVPVVMAGKRRHVPTIIHESDMTPGLANKISIPSATKVCCNFPETLEHLPKEKAVLTGSPIRQELLEGSRSAALEFCGLTDDKPVILIIPVIPNTSALMIINIFFFIFSLLFYVYTIYTHKSKKTNAIFQKKFKFFIILLNSSSFRPFPVIKYCISLYSKVPLIFLYLLSGI